LLFKLSLHSGGFENLPYMGLALPRLISLIFRAGLAVGGSMALPRALTAIVEEHGGVVLTRAHVDKILVASFFHAISYPIHRPIERPLFPMIGIRRAIEDLRYPVRIDGQLKRVGALGT